MTDRRADNRRSRRRHQLGPLIVLWSIASLLLTLLAVQQLVPYDQLMLDPNRSLAVPWYFGLLSNLGVLAWTVAAVSGMLGSWISHAAGRRGASTMLATGSALTLLLLLDDLFQAHVGIAKLFGLPKASVYVAYAVLACAWVGSNWKEIRRTRWRVLLAATMALGTSVVFDQGASIIGMNPSFALVIEDGAKFLGALAWAQYFALTTKDIVGSVLDELTAKASKLSSDSPERDKSLEREFVGLGDEP